MLSVEASISVEGFHYWPDAPERKAFLRTPHRHLFIFVAEVGITTARRVEFFDLQDSIQSAVQSRLWGLRKPPGIELSCEEMAERIGEEIRAANGYEVLCVSVSEDGENVGIWRPDLQ